MPGLTLRDVPEWTTADELTEFCRAAWSDEYAELSLPEVTFHESHRHSTGEAVDYSVALCTDAEGVASHYRANESLYDTPRQAVRDVFYPFFVIEPDDEYGLPNLPSETIQFGQSVLRDVPIITTTDLGVQFHRQNGVCIGHINGHHLVTGPWTIETLLSDNPLKRTLQNPDRPLTEG